MPEVVQYSDAVAAVSSVNFSGTSLLIAAIAAALTFVACNTLNGVRKRFFNKAVLRKQSGTITDTSYNFIVTFLPIAESIARFITIICGVCFCLAAFNISISPILCVMSLFGFGISLGAKDVFTDITRGTMTLMEGKIAIGNFVSIDGSSGIIKSLSIRQIEIQHEDGSTEAFPFSKIGAIRNFSVKGAVAKPSFQVATSASVEKVEQLARETLTELENNSEFSHYIDYNSLHPLTAKIKAVNVDGVEMSFSIRLISGKPGDFVSQFYKIMLPKLQEEGMLN
ncbi:MAG: mechanosensitive ion channel [Holosporales bacterium]|jgi:small conductance mechanosensitive channel|nr:mechanosensitive ion channel [Holosporales bacterium]